MKPNFHEIDLKELKAYILEHTEDDEAFYIYRDRSKIERNWSKKMPPLKSDEDLENYPEFIEHLRRSERKTPD